MHPEPASTWHNGNTLKATTLILATLLQRNSSPWLFATNLAYKIKPPISMAIYAHEQVTLLGFTIIWLTCQTYSRYFDSWQAANCVFSMQPSNQQTVSIKWVNVTTQDTPSLKISNKKSAEIVNSRNSELRKKKTPMEVSTTRWHKLC